MRGIVDRIEDGIATIELDNGEMMDIKSELYDFKEGDVVRIESDRIVVDDEATETRKSEIENLFKSLLE